MPGFKTILITLAIALVAMAIVARVPQVRKIVGI